MQKRQKNTLDDTLLLLLSLSTLLFNSVEYSLLGLGSLSDITFSVDEDDLTILGDNDLTTLGILSSWK